MCASKKGVTIKFFASLRDVVGQADMQMNVSSMAQLKKNLTERLPADSVAELLAENVRIAVNQTIIDAVDIPLADGDEVAFLPPVTGG